MKHSVYYSMRKANNKTRILKRIGLSMWNHFLQFVFQNKDTKAPIAPFTIHNVIQNQQIAVSKAVCTIEPDKYKK